MSFSDPTTNINQNGDGRSGIRIRSTLRPSVQHISFLLAPNASSALDIDVAVRIDVIVV